MFLDRKNILPVMEKNNTSDFSSETLQIKRVEYYVPTIQKREAKPHKYFQYFPRQKIIAGMQE